MEEIIFKPTLEQLKIDKKKEAVNYILICLCASVVFILLEASALILLLPFGFLPIYHKYMKIKKSLNYRWIKIRNDVVLQDAPGMHIELKKIPYAVYRSAGIRWGEIYFKMKKQKLSVNMKISLGSINLAGYPDKEKIAYKINEKIQQYKI